MSLTRFVPRNEQFFTLFQEEACNAVAAAQTMLDLLEQFEAVERKVRRLRDLEQRGDELTHHLFAALNRTFVTPLDREDIRNLAHALDTFVDYLEEAAGRLQLYQIAQPIEPARQLGRLINQQATIISEAMPLLESAKQREAVLHSTIELNRLENEADEILSQALATLYDGATDIPSVVQALHWGELYQLLEDATDRAEDVADTLEAIVLKHVYSRPADARPHRPHRPGL
jgi:predicted phosphate transport protein (TIGR00153 family)